MKVISRVMSEYAFLLWGYCTEIYSSPKNIYRQNKYQMQGNKVLITNNYKKR
jgi:hypothetical protein